MELLFKTVLGLLGIMTVGVAGYIGYVLWKIVHFISAIKAKFLCSGIFVSNRDPKTVERENLSFPRIFHLLYSRIFHANINFSKQEVTATILGLAKYRAIHRNGLGAILIIGTSGEEIRQQAIDYPNFIPSNQGELPWPEGDSITSEPPSEVDVAKLNKTLDWVFSEPDVSRSRRTRAVVVVYDNQIVAERYALGFTQVTPLPGFSMTKSVINALVGILVGERKIGIHQPGLVPEWSNSEDPRSTITLNHLLRMSSGLKFPKRKHWWQLGDANEELYLSPNAAASAINRPPGVKPGGTWQYYNGNTNIIARIIRDVIGRVHTDYLTFPRQALFNEISMHSAIMEPDPSGTFVGASFMYATARDWARFGLLFLHDGVWQGKRVLPEGWVDYSRTPTPYAPWYGAHFWTNAGDTQGDEDRPYLRLPVDAFFALGVLEQYIAILPSHKLVVVRLGLSSFLPRAEWDLEPFVADVVKAIHQ